MFSAALTVTLLALGLIQDARHFGVAEQALRMRALAQDVDFRRDWYIAATAEFHRAKLQMEPRSMLAQARRDLPESATLFFVSGVVDEEIARLDAPPIQRRRPEQAVSEVNQIRRQFLIGARGHLRSAARMAPDDAKVQLHLGRVLALLDDDRALESLERAASTGDLETRFLASLFTGGFHQQRKRPADAVKWYEQATKLIPGTSPAAVALSQALQQLGRTRDARRVLVNATKGLPPRPGYGPWENYPVAIEPSSDRVEADPRGDVHPDRSRQDTQERRLESRTAGHRQHFTAGRILPAT